MPKVRLNLMISTNLYYELVEMADDAVVDLADVIRQGLALLKVAIDGKAKGLHLGICDDAANLDREIVGLL